MRPIAPAGAAAEISETFTPGTWTGSEPGRGSSGVHVRRREGHLHQRTVIELAGDREARAVRFGERFGERQAEPGPARAPARGRRKLAERLERDVEFLLVHADAGVAHPQQHVAVVRLRGR